MPKTLKVISLLLKSVTVLALARAAPFLIRLRLVGKRASGYLRSSGLPSSFLP